LSKTDKYLRIIPTAIFGLLLVYKLILRADSEILFDGAIIGGLIMFFLISLMWTNSKDIKEYKTTKNKLSFLPSITGLLFLGSVLVTNYIINYSSSVLLQAFDDGGFNGCGFEFKEDGSYKFFNGSGLGVDNFYGTYTLKDSIITLDKSEIDKVIQSNKLAIRPLPYYDTDRKEIIYQINDRHEIVDKDIGFIINVDNRK
jgi:hypothetical protein